MWFEAFQDGCRGGNLLYRNRKRFSNSESLCHSYAAHEVSAQFSLRFGRRCRLKNFKVVAMAAILNTGRNDFKNSEFPCNYNTSHQISAQSELRFWMRCRKCEKLTMDEGLWDGRTDDGPETTDNRPWHNLTWISAR